MNKRKVGSIWEDKAAKYLEEMGYKIICRNFYTYFGEVDIIARDGDTMAFIEVKYRAGSQMGIPEEAVDIKKQKRIYKSAQYYMYKYFGGANIPCRFDVVAIFKNQIRLYKNAFGGI